MSETSHRKIALPTLGKYTIIDFDDLMYCKANGNYTYFFLKEGETIIISKKLKEVEKALKETTFVRVHQSYLLNVKFVKKLIKDKEWKAVLLNGDEIKIARNRKKELLNHFVHF